MDPRPSTRLPELPHAAWESLLARTHALVYAIRRDERVTTINRALLDRLDYPAEQLADLSGLLRLAYPEPAVREAVLAAHRRALTGAGRDFEQAMTSRDGDVRTVRWSPVLVGEGEAASLVLVGEDVTDRRKLEHWVRLQNAIFDRLPEAVVVCDADGRILHWSGASERLLGYSPRAALERPLSNLFHGGEAREQAASLLDLLRTGDSFDAPCDLRRSDGAAVPTRLKATRLLGERGLAGVLLLLAEPPTLTFAEADEPANAAPDAAPLERLVAQPTNVATLLLSPDGTIRVWGRAAERLGGASSAKAVGKRAFDEFFRVQGLHWDAVAARLAQRGRLQQRGVVERPNGTLQPIDLEVHALRAPDGGVSAVLVTAVDRAEADGLAQEALTAKTQALDGIFTEGVTRRVTDTLAYFEPDHRFVLARLGDLRALVRLLEGGASHRDVDNHARRARLGPLDAELESTMARLGEGVHRLRALVDDVARFVSTEAEPPGPVRVGRELAAARDLVGHHFENLVALELILEDLPPIRAARSPLLRGLSLLLLASAASCGDLEGAAVTIEGSVAGGWVSLDVRDNGSGYPVEVQSRLGDAAFLASQPGYSALYLGLAREALRAAGGNLEIGTASGTGARVRVSFPAAEAAASAAAVDLPRATVVHGGSVLLVEEDDLLRGALRDALGEMVTVTALGAVADALPLMSERSFDAAILSFPRPEAFGARLLARFGEASPELRRNTIVLVPHGLRASTRERLVEQGYILVARPADVTLLRSLLGRLLPVEELALGE